MFRHALVLLLSFMFCACAYQFGYESRKVPGGYTQISVPMFTNKSQDVGAEAYFTNALVREFERSRVATVTEKSLAPVVLKGTVESVTMTPHSQVAANGNEKDLKYLPRNTVINTTYRLYITVLLELERSSDKKILWQQRFNNEQIFESAQVSLPLLNSVNSLYNHSAKQQNIKELAQLMMKEAHDRMTERF